MEDSPARPTYSRATIWEVELRVYTKFGTYKVITRGTNAAQGQSAAIQWGERGLCLADQHLYISAASIEKIEWGDLIDTREVQRIPMGPYVDLSAGYQVIRTEVYHAKDNA